MKYDEVWSYPIDRIQEYFHKEGIDAFIVQGDDANNNNSEVRLESLPDRKVGNISFPQTRVVIECERAEQIYHGFYLHFLSGGA